MTNKKRLLLGLAVAAIVALLVALGMLSDRWVNGRFVDSPTDDGGMYQVKP